MSVSERLLAFLQTEPGVLAASALLVAFMVLVAALLGFRQTERLDEAAMRALAAAEGLSAEAVLVSARGEAGVVRLPQGKVLVARVMADGVSARVADAARVRVGKGRVSVAFADIGYPPLSFRLKQDAPAWLSDLARG
jgi:hypothetical protein